MDEGVVPSFEKAGTCPEGLYLVFELSGKRSFFLWSRNRLQIDVNGTRKPVAEIKARLHGASCLFLRDELPCSNLRGPVNWLSECGWRGCRSEGTGMFSPR